jgi:3-hydroxyacyl-[acyl-carrier-protein] dehydratase
MTLDFEEIKKLIPQRFPFIMIDKILEVEPGKHAVSVKNVSGNDIFFLGHFPERAIMPGVAIIEAMAQTAIILFAIDNKTNMLHGNIKDNENNPLSPPFSKGGMGGFSDEKKRNNKKPIYYFGSVKARFLHPVVPGDQLRIKAVNVKSLPNGAFVSAEAFVGDKKVSEAELVFTVKDEA